MRVFQICNTTQLNLTINEPSHGHVKTCFYQTVQGKFTARQINFRSYSRDNQVYQIAKRLSEERNILKRRSLIRFAMAMEKMEITEEQIFQQKQRAEEEETFLGEVSTDYSGQRFPANLQEELPERIGVESDEGGPKLGAVGSELRECWDLWQRVGLPVKKIAKQRHMTETGVFYCIFTCIQKHFMVDWYELCKEARFTLDIANRMIQATETSVANISDGPVDSRKLRQHLPEDISEVHYGIFVTMLVRGLPFETMREISLQIGGIKPEMEWGEEYADEERFPKEVSDIGLLQWFADKNGVTMIEIVLQFRECDDLELMRIILRLEEEGKLFWRHGVFRRL